MSKCLNVMYQNDYHNRNTIIINIAECFRNSYCQMAIMSLLGTLPNELLKILYEKFHEWIPVPDDVKFSRIIKFLDERLYDKR